MELGLDVELTFEPRQSQKPSDCILTMTSGGRTHRYAVDVKRAVHQRDVGVLLVTSRPAGSVIAAPRISREAGERLRNAGIGYIDTAGNAYLTGPGLLILIAGRKSKSKGPKATPDRAFRPAGLKLLLALLSSPGLLNSSYRELAEVSEISLGSVTHVLQSLKDLEFLFEAKGRRHFQNREALLNEWAKQYGRHMLDREVLGRFSALESGWWRNATRELGGGLWGGEVAAARLTGNLRPEEISIYAESVPRSIVKSYRLRKDEEGPIVFRRKFWHFDHPLQTTRRVVPPPLIYAELLALGDPRTAEAAKIIEERYIRGSLES